MIDGRELCAIIGDEDGQKAGSVALAFSLTRCLLPGGSKRLSTLL